MANDFYNHGSFPTTGSAATSASMRAELDSIAVGFDKMPTLTGNPNEIVVVDATGTALTSIVSLPATAGGTGQTSYAIGDLLYASTTTALSKLADVATGNALISGGVGVAPSYGKIGLTTHVSGTLPVANGGTNLTSFTANGVVYASSTSALATGSAFTFDGTGAVISVASSSDALRITQTGSGNALLIEDSANPDSSPFVIDQFGRLIVGHTANTVPAGTNPFVQVQSNGSTQSAILGWSVTSAAPPIQSFYRSASGIVGTYGTVASGFDLGELSFFGDDGTAFIEAASILAEVDGTPGTNDMPGRLVFSTTADGAATPTERMRIDSAGQVTIGGSPTAGVSVYLRKDLTGATTSFGVAQNVEIQSDVTTTANLFNSTYSTDASAFTLTNVNHYNAQQGTIGAGSAVTNQYGFAVQSSFTGATNNYGFYGNIAAGTGRYNFYANGTAENFFGGNTVISVTDNTNAALRITQLGTGNALLIEDSANPDSTPFVIDATGNVYSGYLTPFDYLSIGGGTLNPRISVAGTTGDLGSIGAAVFANATTAPTVVGAKSRNTTVGSHTVVQSGDSLLNILAEGSDGTAFIRAASIVAAVDGTPGTNDMPGRLVFSTTADGAATPTERLRITSTGALAINGGTSYGTAGQALISAGDAAPVWTDQFLSITYILSSPTANDQGDLTIPFNCTITEWTLLADVSGSIVIDIWKDTYANYPPTVADTITGSAKPTISSAVKGQSSTLTGWTATITAGDTLRFNVDSASTVSRVTLSLKVKRT